MRSRKYWQDRASALEYYIQQDATKVRNEIMRLFGEALDNIDRETSKIRHELGKVTGKVTEEELDELLGFAERDKSYQELLQIMNDTDDEAAKAMLLERINAQAYGARIKRVDAIGNKILGEFIRVAEKEKVLCKELFSSVYAEAYYTNIYHLAEGYHAGVSFDVLPKRAIQAALQEDWNGANYSSRIWNHSQAFAEQVEETVVSGLVSGKSTQKMAMELSGFANDDAYYVKERLIRSETAHFMSRGQNMAYVAAGIGQYRFLAALSERTCEVCGALDNKVFAMEEATEGENFPPMHPNCRCVTITADVTLKSRVAKDPENGYNYKVDGNMSFAQWKESLSDEQKQAFDLHVRQMRNKSADKKQYDRYIRRLGAENLPKTFDKFQEIKYTDIKTWGLLKDYYKSRGTNMISVFTSFDDYVLYKGKIEDEIIGLVTIDGVEIKAQSKHFIERVFGTNEDPKTGDTRDGVEIEGLKEALARPLQHRNKRDDGSKKYIGEKATITVNTDTGVLVQCNPTDSDLARRLKK